MRTHPSKRYPSGMISFWTVALVGLLAFFLLIYTTRSWRKDFRENIHLLKGLMQSRVALAEGSLWLEEHLRGDEAISLEMIMGLYEAAARGVASANHLGASDPEDMHPTLIDPETGAILERFRGSIERFREIARQRWENRARDHRDAALDRAFSHAFHDAGLAASALDLQLQRNIDNIMAAHGRTHTIIMVLWSSVVAAVCFGLFYVLRRRGIMEQALRNSEERFRNVFENSPVAMAISRMDSGVISEVNSGFTRLFGCTEEEVSGRWTMDDDFWPDEATGKAFLSRLEKDGRVDNLELSFRRKDGSTAFGLISGNVMTLHDGPHLLTITEDIGELKRAQDALNGLNRDLEERVNQRTSQLRAEIAERKAAEGRVFRHKRILQKVFDGISEPLILFNKDLSIQICNPAAKDYYRINGSGIAPDIPCYQSLMGRAEACPGCRVAGFQGSQGGMVFERTGIRDPSRFEEVTLFPVPGQGGDAEGFIARIKDITQARIMQRQIIHREKMVALGILVSSIAHEIDNPNTFIHMNVPILRDYLEDLLPVLDTYAGDHPEFEISTMPYTEFREDVFRLLGNLENGTAKISSFVSNLREFSRVGKGTGFRDWVDLREVIERGVAICRNRLNRTVRTFRWNVPEDLPPVFTDPGAIEQLVINLLINASAAVDKQESRVELSVEPGPTWQDHVIIRVSDNGCGMDKETVEKIFDPFFTTGASGDGTGLGLYICHNIVENLGGRIEVESRPGEGAVFRIVLPDKDRRQAKRL